MTDAGITRARQLVAAASGLCAAGLFWSKIHQSSGPTFVPITALAIAAAVARCQEKHQTRCELTGSVPVPVPR